METNRSFRIDRSNGKLLGVCAGIADHFDLDVTLVRVLMVLAAATTFPVVLIGYLVLALVAGSGEGRKAGRTMPARRVNPAAQATRERLRELDARLQLIEREIVDSRNSALAREIDALR